MGLFLPKLPFGVLIPSKQLLSGDRANGTAGLLTSSVTGITATAAGTQSNSYQAITAFVEVTTVASANDSIVLPLAKAGLRVCVTNSGAGNSLQIFANGSDVINATAGNVGVALAQNATALFICTKDGVWKRFVSA